MAKEQPLPFIPRKYLRPDHKVDLWDVLIEGGPVKIEFTSMLAREALVRDPERYKFDLPRGVKPGQLQFDAEDRARALAEEAESEPPDPVFGRSST
jgi:hypothetical protein